MSRAATTRTVGDQITTRLTGFGLTTAARELVSRFVEAEQQPALPLLLDVLELEAALAVLEHVNMAWVVIRRVQDDDDASALPTASKDMYPKLITVVNDC